MARQAITGGFCAHGEIALGRQIKLAASAELWADGKRKWSHDSSQGTEEEVVIRRRVVEETVVMSHRHVSRSGTE